MRKMLQLIAAGALVEGSGGMIAKPAVAQDIDMADTVYAGDYLSVGAGVALNPSYAGSDDYVLTPIPLVQGSIGGVAITPRAGGLALDFVPGGEKVDFDLGIAGRLRGDRAVQIKDPVVASFGKLRRAIEIGPSVGLGFSQVLNPYDTLSLSADVLWDVNGAHGGMVVSPSVSYFTPVSRGVAASLSLSSEWADSEFHDYYFRVTPQTSFTTGPVLPAFAPDGAGFTRVGAVMLLGVDLNGDLTDGGLALVAVAGYSQMLGDARRTPFTSVVGSRSQFLGALGVGYTF